MTKIQFKHTIWIVFGIFTFNFILKFLYIDHSSVGGDEPFSIFYAQTDFQTLIELSKNENNPPFFTFLLKIWTGFFGISSISVRFLPLLFSSLTAVFIYTFMRKLTNLQFGLLASGLFTFSNYHIFFSHEARPYALFGLLTILALYYSLRTLESNKKRWLVFLTITNILLIYNHFFGFFVLMIEFFMLTIVPIENKNWRKMIKSWIITALFYIPYLPILFMRFLESSEGGTWLTIPRPEELYSIFVKFSNVPVVAAFGLLLLLAGILLNRLVWKDKVFTFLIVSLFVPLILIFLISQVVPMFLDRYFVYLGVIYFLALSYFLFKIQMRIAKYAVVSLFFLGFLLTTDLKTGNEEPDHIIVETLKNLRLDKEKVIIAPTYYQYNFVYHYNSELFYEPESCWDKLNEENVSVIQNEQQLNELILKDTCFVILKGLNADLELMKIKQKLESKFPIDTVLFSDQKNELIRFTRSVNVE